MNAITTTNQSSNGTSGSWFEDESFWSECYPYLFTQEHFNVAAQEVRQVLSLLGMAGGSVLDLCCGPGRHSVALAQHGLQVTAVDRSDVLLDIAKAKAAAAGVEIEFVREDMRRFVRPQAFDVVLNMYSSFGYFEDKEDDLAVLHNMHESLRPGGTCLLDMLSQAWLLTCVEPVHTIQEADGTLFVQYYEIVENGARQRITWSLHKDGQERSFTFYIRIFSGPELRQLMLQAGFTRVELYGHLEGTRYRNTSNRLIAVGHKAPPKHG